MTSGVKCTDQVKDICKEMRVVKSDADQQKRIRLVLFKIEDSCIDVSRCVCEEELVKDGKDGFSCFQEMMVEGECCYILYDCHFDTKECRNKEELVFLTWCSDGASIKNKMCYAASKDAIKKCVGSIKHNLEMTEKVDCVNRAMFAEKLGKGIISLEGVSC
ncbi:cofilin-1-like [Sparus aurata]|uniref:Cofilin-1-like n=1 Tax=Sparus aurata TaxID=8175 RepID=A0A671YQQ7_SPAAU|nr:cofilin-1-like [Sparus aurata]